MAAGPISSIMIVDDEPDVINALKRLFFMENFHILTAPDGCRALDMLKTTDTVVRLIISDQRMPEMEGADFLEQSRDIFPYALRFLLTAHSDVDILISAVNKGRIHGFFSKPWNDNDMRRRIRDALQEQNVFLKNAALHNLTPKESRNYRRFNRQLEETLNMTDDRMVLNLDDSITESFCEKPDL